MQPRNTVPVTRKLLLIVISLAIIGIAAFSSGYYFGNSNSQSQITITQTITQTQGITQTVTTTTTLVSAASSETWHQIAVFKGVADKTTDPFEIKGKRFQFTYNITGAQELTALYVSCYAEGETPSITSIMAGGNKKTSDTTIVYRGPGRFYFKIAAANLDGWQIIIEDFY